MKIQITAEQPFQVLGTTFTIGPSESGYDLYFSADGRNYSKLFTVGANVNRQVTQVAAGSYYLLSGNTDTVTVNWMGDCWGGSGSGGGSYVLPVASSDTLGGIKVGSGLTIDANGVLSANGGSGEDWTWVDADDYWDMSQAEKEAVYDQFAEMASAGTYTFGFEMYNGGGEGGAKTKYPFWYYEGDEESGVTKMIFHSLESMSYQDDIESTRASVRAENYVLTRGDDILQQYTVLNPNPTEYWINNMSQGELADMYSTISGITGGESDSASTQSVFENYRFYVAQDFDGQKWCEAFFSNWEEQDGNYMLWIIGTKPTKLSYGFSMQRVGAKIYSDGHLEWSDEGLDLPDMNSAFIYLDSAGTINCESSNLGIFPGENQIYKAMFKWVDPNDDVNWSQAPVKYCYRKYEDGSGTLAEGLWYYFGGEIYIDGVLYKGTWQAKEWEWGNTLAAYTWTTV